VAQESGPHRAWRRLALWAAGPTQIYRQEAVDRFLGSADLRLVAQASVAGATVVTREKPESESRKAIKIPDACKSCGVPWTDPFSAYRNLGLRLFADSHN
jgi:hypothetical protein